MDARVLVPEGLEDMSLEGDRPRHFQVKSRIDKRGRFSVSEACGHVLDAWNSHVGRAEPDALLVVVLERGIEGEVELNEIDRPLAESLPNDSHLRQRLRDEAEERNMRVADLERLLVSTTIVGVDWAEVESRTVAQLADLAPVPPVARRLVERDLRLLVAEAADANASADYEHRRSLSRTELAGIVNRCVELIDVSALQSAIELGICEVLSFSESVSVADDSRFYEGTDTQPHHVAAGLVVPVPHVLDEIHSGLDERSAVVISGPSGVGKSAAMWSAAAERSDVLWFRVLRLSDEDVPHLMRLARAHKITADAPVGFVVDSAGAGSFDGWPQLRSEAAAVPGLLLLATARTEDVVMLGDLSGCAQVPARLDRAAAEVIHRGLRHRGATAAPHWVEALEDSAGLTLEFVHLLTRGRRLREVIDDQIGRRILEGRRVELDVLALVSTADRWSAGLAAADVAKACAISEPELREAMSRLAQEHLVVERNGVMSGLHRLRSNAISESLHAQPPPALQATVKRVLDVVPTEQLHRFIDGLISDYEDAAPTVVDAACDEAASIERLTGYLHGLCIADFRQTAKVWQQIADAHAVPLSAQMLLLSLTATGQPLPEFMPDQLHAAQQAMTSVVLPPSSTDELIARLDEEGLASALSLLSDIEVARRMLAVLHSGDSQFFEALTTNLGHESPLVRTLAGAPLGAQAEFMATAHDCDPMLAKTLAVLTGGETEALRRIREHNPWITALDIRTSENGDSQAHCRFLQVSDEIQPDAREGAVAVARCLLRCLPAIETVDVRALVPGGHEIRIAGFEHGISMLERQYDHADSTIAWNRTRTRVALSLIGQPDTLRLASAQPLLVEAADLLDEVGTRFVTGALALRGTAGIDERIAELHQASCALPPSLGTSTDNDVGGLRPAAGTTSAPGREGSEHASALQVDDLSALLLDFTGNMLGRLQRPDEYLRLAAYIKDTVIGIHLEGAQSERWTLVGIDGHPASLDRIRKTLLDLWAVVYELAVEGDGAARLVETAGSERSERTLRRTAEACRGAQRRRLSARRRALERLCRSTGLDARVLSREEPLEMRTEFAVTVELDSLLKWPEAELTLESVLQEQQEIRETFLIVPLHTGQPVPSLAVNLINSPLPAFELGRWSSALPDAPTFHIADLNRRAHEALCTLSGIAHLPADQQEHHEVERLAETATTQFLEAHESLSEQPSDPLIDGLLARLATLATQVHAEYGDDHAGPTLAEQMTAGTLQIQTSDEFETTVLAGFLALEWDIDPEGANCHLTSDG